MSERNPEELWWEEAMKDAMLELGGKQYQPAGTLFKACLDRIREDSPKNLRVCLSLSALSIVCEMGGDLVKARNFYQEAVSLWNESGYSLNKDNTVLIETFAHQLEDAGFRQALDMIVRLRDLRAGDTDKPPFLVPGRDIKGAHRLRAERERAEAVARRTKRQQLAVALVGLVCLPLGGWWVSHRSNSQQAAHARVGALELQLHAPPASAGSYDIQLEVRNAGSQPEKLEPSFDLRVVQAGTEVYRAAHQGGPPIKLEAGKKTVLHRTYEAKSSGGTAAVDYRGAHLTVDL